MISLVELACVCFALLTPNLVDCCYTVAFAALCTVLSASVLFTIRVNCKRVQRRAYDLWSNLDNKVWSWATALLVHLGLFVFCWIYFIQHIGEFSWLNSFAYSNAMLLTLSTFSELLFLMSALTIQVWHAGIWQVSTNQGNSKSNWSFSLFQQHNAHTFYNYNNEYDAAVHGGWAAAEGWMGEGDGNKNNLSKTLEVSLLLFYHLSLICNITNTILSLFLALLLPAICLLCCFAPALLVFMTVVDCFYSDGIFLCRVCIIVIQFMLILQYNWLK